MKLFASKDIKLKPRKKTSHKGQNGKALIIGGSKDYTGAPAFVAIAALRAGADLVTVAAPERAAWAICEFSPDIISRKLSGDYLSTKNLAECIALSKEADVVVLGNGIGVSKKVAAFVNSFLKKNKTPVLIDADALKQISIRDVDNAILTPHAGEYQQLLRNSKIQESKIKKNVRNNILVLKGHPLTRILSKSKVIHTNTGHPGMTHGGVGDVLAGIIAGLIAQHNDPFISCAIATYINGKIGESLAREYGVGYLASDFLTEIPKQLKRHISIR